MTDQWQLAVDNQIEVDSYFVANYPPFHVLLERFFLPEHAGLCYT